MHYVIIKWPLTVKRNENNSNPYVSYDYYIVNILFRIEVVNYELS